MPGDTDGFTQLVFSSSNGELPASIPVAGGTAFRIKLDGDHHYDFALGWDETGLGFSSCKAGVVESSDPKDGHHSACRERHSISSHVFQGEDEQGRKAQFRINISTTPRGKKPLYVVKQVLVG
ncbi:uncharacterized protein BXZ73DRAFT_103910 [Epithele typhae]|uniref:uncharacterized protein n=1 Tax=Epithele typhae TaxID=378194 RepID=UPI002007CAD3|nr:uncharacterized protein BXZ73DRAFT_103910 [Epithele typhae]KAH9923477.1 hypothetical protein BXZ73DRAFT_103910 [Epithele typhae]